MAFRLSIAGEYKFDKIAIFQDSFNIFVFFMNFFFNIKYITQNIYSFIFIIERRMDSCPKSKVARF